MNQHNKPRIKEPSAAAYLGMSPAWLRMKRMRGQSGGPPFYKVGRSVLYDVRDLDNWLSAHRVTCE